jgi:hypothetical protein
MSRITCEPKLEKNMKTTQSQNSTATTGGHTPGPWEADVKSYRLPMVINSTGKMTVANSIFGESAEIAEANARLIAQAPAMLEALKATREMLRSLENRMAQYLSDDECRELSCVHKQALAVLAAVEGTK